MNRNPYLDIVHALRAGYTIWEVIPLLSKLPDGFFLDNPDGGFAYSTRIEWRHPSRNWDCRHFIDIMRKDKFVPEEYDETITKLIFALEAWATEEIALLGTTPKGGDNEPKYRKKDKQSLAEWVDGKRRANPEAKDPDLAREYYQHLKQNHKLKTSSYKKQDEKTSITAITRTIRDIRRDRRKRNNNKKA